VNKRPRAAPLGGPCDHDILDALIDRARPTTNARWMLQRGDPDELAREALLALGMKAAKRAALSEAGRSRIQLSGPLSRIRVADRHGCFDSP
jgi:hypothetical protein